MIVAQTAPLAALAQAKMLRGDLPHDECFFRSCDAILDRVLGKARQQIDILANEEGLKRLEYIGKQLALARGDVIDAPVIDAVTEIKLIDVDSPPEVIEEAEGAE